jgi:general secretion pathway protein H
MRAGEAGFTLVEAVATLAIVAMVAGFALPRWPHETSRPQLEAYALDIASLLKADRAAALQRRAEVATALDVEAREVVSGAGAGSLRLPADVQFEAMVADSCAGRANRGTIAFFPSGMSCGGVVALTRPGAAYRVRVNWLTGGVEVVETDAPR